MSLQLFNDYCFIFDKMKKYGSQYNDEDFKQFLQLPHNCYCYIHEGNIVAFGCVVFINDIPVMSYTWHNNTYIGKKGYLIGFRHIVNTLDIMFAENGSKFNIVRRLNEKSNKS